MQKTLTKFVAGATFIGTLAAASIAFAAPTPNGPISTAPGQNKIVCFDGLSDPDIYSGTCTLNSNVAKGSATLDLTSGDPDGDYAGVYTLQSGLYGATLSSITQLSYHYTASITPQPGNLSCNIPIDTNGDGTTEAYAFVDAYYCPGTGGTVDIVNDPNCGIYYNGTDFYPNWAAFIAAYPGAKVATDNYVFIVAERTGSEPAATYTVNNVKFGKAGK